MQVEADNNLKDEFKKFWEVESVSEVSEESVMKEFFNDITFDGQRYIAKLPFKPNCEFLPDNYQLAKSRLISLQRQLQRDENLLLSYKNIIEEYERDKIIERVSPEDTGEPGAVHYSPHRPVVRMEKETTKVRMVFDLSARTTAGTSLNDCLYAGPNLLSRIFDILLRFRSRRIGIVADIKQAFLQVRIHDDHKDYLRFLWFNYPNTNELVVYRFLRALFGGKSMPFLLQGTIRYHCNDLINRGMSDPEFVNEFLQGLYVDDSNDGADSTSDGFHWYKNAKSLMQSGGFSLRKWCTNDIELQGMIDEEERCVESTSKSVNFEDESCFADFQLGVKKEAKMKMVLGINWDLTRDEFVFDFKSIVAAGESLKFTKRNILKVSSSFFDPLGLISPVTIQSKRVFQALCKEKLNWDSSIPQEIDHLWQAFICNLKSFPQVRVPRFGLPASDDVSSVQLHGFCDSLLCSGVCANSSPGRSSRKFGCCKNESCSFARTYYSSSGAAVLFAFVRTYQFHKRCRNKSRFFSRVLLGGFGNCVVLDYW